MHDFIPLSVPNLKGNELKYVSDAIETEWVSTGGSYINDFEKNVSKYVGSHGAVACQSGTAGLHLALLSCDVNSGDEVFVPTLTFIAAVNPVSYVGATPVFMDCDDSLCMDMDKVEKFIISNCKMTDGHLVNVSTGNQIKAIVLVHIFGNIANIEKAMQLAQQYNLKIIEDATEALGSYIIGGKYDGCFAGTIGDVGVYSFNGNKIITTGGGGMIVSNNEEILNFTKYLSTQAKDDPLYYIHNSIGYNYRMTNVQAAIGLAQLEQLESFIDVKKNNYFEYIHNGIKLLEFREDVRPNYWFYSFLTDDRDTMIKYLDENNIQSRPIWNLISTLPPYIDCISFEIEKASYYLEHIVNIPCSSNLSLSDVNYVSDKIKGFLLHL